MGVVVLVAGHGTHSGEEWSTLLVGVPTALVAALIVHHQPRHVVGWAFAAGGGAFVFQQFLGHYALRGLVVDPGSVPAAEAAAWLQTWLPALGLIGISVVPPLFFPDGRLLSSRWRVVAWCAAVWTVVTALLLATLPGSEHIAVGADQGIENPLGIGAVAPLAWLTDVAAPLLWAALSCAAVASLVLRFRRADPDGRQRIKWLAWAMSLLLVGILVEGAVYAVAPEWQPDVSPLTVLPLLVVAAVAVGILRHRLLDIDLLINRTLVYAALTASIVLVYVLVVGWLGSLFRSSGPVIAFVATAVVAVAFAPLRSRLQAAVNRLLHGDRDDPYRALSRLGWRLQEARRPGEVLPTVARTVAESLRLPYAALRIGQGGSLVTVAAHGQRPPDDRELLRLTVDHQGHRLGELVAAPRSPGERLSAADVRLLEDLARQAGPALEALVLGDRATQLTADLQRSRERLVSAREEERRRLGRDIHDGLGPQLAGLAMKLEAARELVASDPAGAEALLAGLLDEAEGTIDELRRMAYLLRPPALDALGLVRALEVQASAHRGLDVTIEAQDTMPELPAAVEMAAYRIAGEALRNAARHAHATSCVIRLQASANDLALSVLDDGRGISESAATGVGTAAMRERAEELGGAFAIESGTAGTRVVASLPLTAAEHVEPA